MYLGFFLIVFVCGLFFWGRGGLFFNLKQSYNAILLGNLEGFSRSSCTAPSHTVHMVNKLFQKHSGQHQDTTDQQQLVHCMLQNTNKALAIVGAIPHFQPLQKCSCLTEKQDGTKAAADTNVPVSFMLNFQF